MKIKYHQKILKIVGNDRGKIPKIMVLFVIASLLDVLGLSFIAPYISLATNPESVNEFFSFKEFFNLSSDKDVLTYIGIILVAVFFIKSVTTVLVNKIIIDFSQDQKINLRLHLMRSFQKMPYATYIGRNSAEYIYSIGTLSDHFAQVVVMPILRMVSNGIVVVAIFLFLAVQNTQALLILMLIFGFTVMGYDAMFKAKVALYGKKSNLSSIRMLKGINEGMKGFKELRALGVEGFFYQCVKQGAIANGHYKKKGMLLSSSPKYLLEFLMILFIVALVVVAQYTSDGMQLLLPTLSVFGIAAIRLLPSINILTTGLIELRNGKDTVDRLYKDLIELEGGVNNSKTKFNKNIDNSLKKTIPSDLHGIEIDNVTYQYPGAKHPALTDVSFSIKVGDSIGIKGGSGSGKTTLIDVILGLLSPQKGVVKYNGISKSDIAYLPQSVLITDDTLKNNIALGVEEGDINITRVEKAIQQAQLTSLLKELPNGLETVLGDGGIRVSGGQKQRIALARAFYHQKNILVMDESTSALDSETEKEITREVQMLKGRKTVIVIAHRLSTLKYCDRVYKISDGNLELEEK